MESKDFIFKPSVPNYTFKIFLKTWKKYKNYLVGLQKWGTTGVLSHCLIRA